MGEKRSSGVWRVIFLWIIVVFLGLVALSAVFWLFAAPVEMGVEVSVDGQVVQRESRTDLTILIFPTVILAASLLGLIWAVLSLRRAFGGDDRPGPKAASRPR